MKMVKETCGKKIASKSSLLDTEEVKHNCVFS